jgi:hypothetical protein
MPPSPGNKRGPCSGARAGEPPYLAYPHGSLAPPPARLPWGSDYLRQLTRREGEALGDGESLAAPRDF